MEERYTVEIGKQGWTTGMYMVTDRLENDWAESHTNEKIALERCAELNLEGENWLKWFKRQSEGLFDVPD